MFYGNYIYSKTTNWFKILTKVSQVTIWRDFTGQKEDKIVVRFITCCSVKTYWKYINAVYIAIGLSLTLWLIKLLVLNNGTNQVLLFKIISYNFSMNLVS